MDSPSPDTNHHTLSMNWSRLHKPGFDREKVVTPPRDGDPHCPAIPASLALTIAQVQRRLNTVLVGSL
jgi:hypothetical protein